MNKKTVKELIELCKQNNIKGYSHKTKKQLIQLVKNIKNMDDRDESKESNDDSNESKEYKENKHDKDTYTKEMLMEQYKVHKNYINARKQFSRLCKIEIRFPCFPEDLSENIIKFICHKLGDLTCSWNCGKGDLRSSARGRQECKCFTSNGPISFTPTSEWDELLFLDARRWNENDLFVLYRLRCHRTSEEWKSIKVSKTQTFEDQVKQGRRPRIGWRCYILRLRINVRRFLREELMRYNIIKTYFL